jgi:hypothetical protein
MSISDRSRGGSMVAPLTAVKQYRARIWHLPGLGQVCKYLDGLIPVPSAAEAVRKKIYKNAFERYLLSFIPLLNIFIFYQYNLYLICNTHE